MIANTQANPLSGLLASLSPAALGVTGSAAGQPAQRFDLTLLEMTKHVTDGMAQKTAVPEKVRKALETVLNALANQSPETKMQLGKTPEAITFQHTLVTQAARAANLTVTEHKQLDELAGMVVNRVQASLQPVISLPGKETELEGALRAIPVLHSGPYGGTTEPIEAAVSKPDTADTTPEEMARQLPQLAAALLSPSIVSARTQIDPDSSSEAKTPISVGRPTEFSQGSKPVVQAEIVLSSLAPKPVQAAVTAPEMTMKKDPQPAMQAPVSQAAAPRALTLDPKISPEINKNSNQMQNTAASTTAPRQSTEPGTSTPVHPQSVQTAPAGGGATADRRTVPVPVPVSASSPKAAVVPQAFAPEIEIQVLTPGQSLPPVAEGSEIRIFGSGTGIALDVPKENAAAMVMTPAVTREQAFAPTLGVQQAAPSTAELALSQAPAFQAATQVQETRPQAVPVQPATLAVPVPGSASQDNVINTTALDSDSDEGQAVRSMSRFLDEAGLRASTAREMAPLTQAPLHLSQETVKDLAASISREYSLRENVFQQAVAAIEDAGQVKSHIRIQLRPESLGHLEVALSVEGGKLTARLIASSDEVRDIFAANLAQFKQALESQGLTVNQISVAVRAETGAQGQPQQAWQQQPAWQASREETPQAANAWTNFNVLAGGADGSSTFNALA